MEEEKGKEVEEAGSRKGWGGSGRRKWRRERGAKGGEGRAVDKKVDGGRREVGRRREEEEEDGGGVVGSISRGRIRRSKTRERDGVR